MKTRNLKTLSAIAIPLLTVAFLLAVVAESADAAIFRITVRLNGNQQVRPVPNTGTGVARIVVDTATRSIMGNVRFRNLLANTTAGHIHMAPVGVNGPIILILNGGRGVMTGRMSIRPGAVLTAAQLRALRNNRLYFNIHTVLNRGGEIRGQIFWNRRVLVASSEHLPSVEGGQDRLGALRTAERMGAPAPYPYGRILAAIDRMAPAETSGNISQLTSEDLGENAGGDLGG